MLRWSSARALDAALVELARAARRRGPRGLRRSRRSCCDDDGVRARRRHRRPRARHRGRRPLVTGAARARTRRATRSRRMARGAAVLRRRRRRRLWVLFERDLLPGLRVGVPAARRTRQRRLRRAARRRPHRARAEGPVARRSSTRPVLRDDPRPARRARSSRCMRGRSRPATTAGRLDARARVLFAGDAAGVVDPMTGEGIAQAHRDRDARGRGDRDRRRLRAALVHRALGRDLRFAACAADASCAIPSAREPRSAPPTSTPWTRRNFARWMWEDYPRALLGTPDRWHRGTLSVAGAWHDAPSASRNADQGAIMANGKAEISIDRSPDDVWKLVRDFGGLADWMPGIESCTVDGDVRTIGMMGIEIKEAAPRPRRRRPARITYCSSSRRWTTSSRTSRRSGRARGLGLASHVVRRRPPRRAARVVPPRLRRFGRRAQEEARSLIPSLLDELAANATASATVQRTKR